MILKHTNPSVFSGDPYKECYTGRISVGNSLIGIIDNIEFGGTISLVGEWGSGKTSFLRMWSQELKDRGFPTVFLNAWETEWAEDPLIAVISCIYKACPNASAHAKKINAILKRFAHNPLPMLGAVLKTVLEPTIGVDPSLLLSEYQELASNAFDSAVASFSERQNAMTDLKGELEKLAWDVNQGEKRDKPLVFIIDELDRCKPDYAVRMLEVLKHFFEVRNIVFVCAVDKKHLEESIRGFYGSEGLDATEYLRRFFDLEVELPTPDYQKFCDHLYGFYELGDFFDSPERVKETSFKKHGFVFKAFLSSLARRSHMTLRQLDRICAFTRITLIGKNKNLYYFPDLSLFLTYLRFFDFHLYQDIKSMRLSAQELLDRVTIVLGDTIKPNELGSHDDGRKMIINMIGSLLFFYNEGKEIKEYIYNPTGNDTNLKTTMCRPEELAHVIRSYYLYDDSYSLKWLFDVLDILKMEEE